MGRQVLRAIVERPDVALGGVWVRRAGELSDRDLDAIGGDAASSDLAAVIDGADVALDFTLPAANGAIVEAVVAAGKPYVCGVSGLDDSDLASMRAAARAIPVFHDRNMSLGVAVMRRLAEGAAAVLGEDFPVRIHDTHHAGKRDAPSGTALLLGEALAAGRGRRLRDVMHYDPDGDPPTPIAPGDIVFHVTRAGEYPGRHEVCFEGTAERLTLIHDVGDRAVFALGALRAARWVVAQPPGLYDMQDLLGTVAGRS